MVDTVEFEFEVTVDGTVPDWAWREGPWRGQATREAISLARGGIPAGTALVDAFQQVFTQFVICAAHKVEAAHGQIAEPVIVDADDLMR